MSAAFRGGVWIGLVRSRMRLLVRREKRAMAWVACSLLWTALRVYALA